MLAVFGPEVAPAAAHALAAAFARYQEAAENIDLAHLLGLPRWVPTPQSRRARQAARDIRALIEDLLQRHTLTAPFARFAAVRRDDGSAVLHHAALVDEIAMMLLAGSETSANGLAWATKTISSLTAQR
jgi:cytochrome P450